MFGLNLFKTTKTKKVAQNKKKTIATRKPTQKTTVNKSVTQSSMKKNTTQKTYKKPSKK